MALGTDAPRRGISPDDDRPPKQAADHLPVLDGVRGLAIFFVLCAHGARFLPGQHSIVGHAGVVLLNLGWCGVQLFFVLSGFLITRLLLAKKGIGGAARMFGEFYSRRALRIFPLYYVALAIVFAVRWGTGLDVGPAPSDAWWYVAYLQNWYNATGHIPEAVGHFWSLAIEEQFYIVWPLVVVACSRRSLARVCLGVVVAVIAVRLAGAYWLDVSSIWLYHSTATQLDGLAMGGLLAVIAAERAIEREAGRARVAIASGALALLALVVVSRTTAIFGVNTPFSVGASLAFSLAFTGLLLYVLADPGSVVGRLLQRPALRGMGRISYGLYVVHYPVSWALARPAFGQLGAAALVAYVGLSFGLALFSWRFVEGPFLAIKDRLGRRSDLALGARAAPSPRS